MTALEVDHKEVDTSAVLHCLHASVDSTVVSVRGTDVLVRLLVFYDKMPRSYLWMKSGIAKTPKFIPVHDVRKHLTAPQVDAILGFHSLTGCDGMSQFFGHRKSTAWPVFKEHHDLLDSLGKGEITDDVIKSSEAFI